MHVRAGLLVLACCAALAACTAAPPKGPDANVTTPAIGKPAPPASAQAALSSEAFTPYADIGASASDGLALGDTYQALHTACMNAAGYGQYASDSPIAIRANNGLGFAQPFGPWGYLGMALAQQYGFDVPLSGPLGGGPGSGGIQIFNSLPEAIQAAGDKCFNIVLNFNDAMFAGPLAGVETINNELSTDVIQDHDFTKALTVWSACMGRNGYTTSNADDFALNELDSIGAREIRPGGPTTPTAAQQQADIAMAVTDAQCTQQSDLAGIYFAVQASYEQQFVNSNSQALTVAVRRYKAAFASELAKLPELLRTAAAKIKLSGPRKPAPSAIPSTASAR